MYRINGLTKKDYYDTLLILAIDASYVAGEEIMKVKNSINIGTRLKENKTQVTDADINANNVIISALSVTNIPIISEESEIPDRFNNKLVWIVDPLDGTSEFVNGGDEFTVNIALVEDNKVVLGVVYVPVTKELYFANKYIGSYKYVGDDLLEYEDIKEESTKLPYTQTEVYTIVASKNNLDLITTGFIEGISKGKDVNYVNRSSSLKFCVVAEGNADIYPRFAHIAEWDTAAAHAIVKYAGKNVRDMNGNELRYNKAKLGNPYFICQ